MAYPGFATIQVRTELSLPELYALYWDSLIDRLGDADMAEKVITWGDSRFVGRKPVTDMVREWLTWYGERSVECGARNPYPSDEFEAKVKAVVARAYKIVY